MTATFSASPLCIYHIEKRKNGDSPTNKNYHTIKNADFIVAGEGTTVSFGKIMTSGPTLYTSDWIKRHMFVVRSKKRRKGVGGKTELTVHIKKRKKAAEHTVQQLFPFIFGQCPTALQFSV
jgi:predicted acetyltransferase